MAANKDRYIHLWVRPAGGQWEWIDTADASNTKSFLMVNYQQALGPGWEYKWRKYRN